MKKVFLILSIFISLIALRSQPYLYGITFKGNGVITKYDLKSNELKAVYELTESDGEGPYSSLISGPDGSLYGLTAYSGSSNYGTIFSFDPSTSQFSKLHDFNGLEGGQPSGSLVKATNGKLYGMSLMDDAGNIFSYNPENHLYRKEYIFNKADGEGLFGSLTQASDGKLYGLAYSGGNTAPDDQGLGALFVFDPSTNNLKKLITFEGKNGANPFGSLAVASDKKLYGTTSKGGNNNLGVLFSFDPSSGIFTKLYDFDGQSGAMPFSNLMQASNGLLYGTTQSGGKGHGILFSFNPSDLSLVKLHDFDVKDGCDPSGTLVEASNNLLYGTTEHGGKYNQGVLYCMNPKTLNFTILQHFDGSNGAFPHYGALIEIKSPTTTPATPVNKLTLSTFPNPSSTYFNISIKNNRSNDKVELRVFDASGKLVEIKKTNANTVLQVGHSYLAGTYFIKASQGNEKATLELIKK